MTKNVIDCYFRSDIKERCIHILSGQIPRELRVVLGGFEVSAASLAKVASKIKTDDIKVGYFEPQNPYIDDKGYALYPPGFADMNPGRMATYLIDFNELWLTKPPLTPAQEAIVAHEATHAFYDLNGWDCSTQIAEGAAHIVEGWYLWRSGFIAEGSSREALMVAAAKAMANISVPALRNDYKKKHPMDWKEKLAHELKTSYDKLIKDLKKSYNVKKTVKFDG